MGFNYENAPLILLLPEFYENLPTETLSKRLRQLAANTDPTRMAECGAAIPIIVEVLNRRSAKQRAVAPPVPVAKHHDFRQGLKQVYREILKSALRIATPEERIELLAREHAALTRSAPSTDGTDLEERIHGVFDREDLTDEIVELAVSTEPPSLPLPPPNATHTQPVEQEGAVTASIADAPQIPDYNKQAPWLLPEDKAATAARLREFQEHIKRNRQAEAIPPLKAALVTGISEATDATTHAGPVPLAPLPGPMDHSRARALTVARIIGELNILKYQMFEDELEYKKLSETYPNFLVFEIAKERNDLKRKILAIQGSTRHIRLAQELAAAYYGKARTTIEKDWKVAKPEGYRKLSAEQRGRMARKYKKRK